MSETGPAPVPWTPVIAEPVAESSLARGSGRLAVRVTPVGRSPKAQLEAALGRGPMAPAAPPQLEQVVGGAHQLPLGGAGCSPASREAAEAASVLGLEHRLHDLGPRAVAVLAVLSVQPAHHPVGLRQRGRDPAAGWMVTGRMPQLPALAGRDQHLGSPEAGRRAKAGSPSITASTGCPRPFSSMPAASSGRRSWARSTSGRDAPESTASSPAARTPCPCRHRVGRAARSDDDNDGTCSIWVLPTPEPQGVEERRNGMGRHGGSGGARSTPATATTPDSKDDARSGRR